MGCGCKKRKLAAQKVAQEKGVDATPPVVNEEREYQLKVRDAIKQFIDLKSRKQNLRGR